MLRRLLRPTLLLAGLLLLGAILYRTGLAQVITSLWRMGWWYLPVLLISASWFLLNTLGWRCTFEREAPPPYGPLLRAHLISESVSNVTPFMALGGEPLKIVLLRKLKPTGEILASVFNDNLAHLTSAVIFMLAGLLLGIRRYSLDAQVLHLLWLGIGLATLLPLGLLGGARAGAFAWLARLAQRLPIAALQRQTSLVARAHELDEQIVGLLWRRTGAFSACLLLHLLGRLMGALEAWVILRALGTPVGLDTAVFIIAVIHVLVNLVFSFVPSQLGVQEAAAYLLFTAVGLQPAAAVAMALVRRIRSFFWIAVGLLLLALLRQAPSPAREPERAPVDLRGDG